MHKLEHSNDPNEFLQIFAELVDEFYKELHTVETMIEDDKQIIHDLEECIDKLKVPGETEAALNRIAEIVNMIQMELLTQANQLRIEAYPRIRHLVG